jgi:hypothetical protein
MPSLGRSCASLLVMATIVSIVVASVGLADAAPMARWEMVSRPLIQRVGSSTFDGSRGGKVVAISRERGDGSLWDWDGKQWSAWYAETPGPNLENAAIAADGRSSRLVLVTAQAEVWELDLATRHWDEIDPVGGRPRPPSRYYFHELVSAPDSGLLYDMNGGDLWEWNVVARTWTERPSLNDHVFARAFDRDRQKLVVLSSDLSYSVAVNEWGENEQRWSSVIPSGIGGPVLAAAYDPVKKATVAFGPNGEVWQWDPAAGAFTLRVSGGTPPQLDWGAVTFDSYRQVFVFMGRRWIGSGAASRGSGERRDEVWEWSPVTDQWSLGTPPHDNPGGASYAAAVYVSGEDRVLMAGGTVLDGFSWWWSPEARTWVPIDASTTAPPPAGLGSRSSVGLAYDVGRGVAVVFGGTSTPTPLFDDLWEMRIGFGLWSKRIASGPAPAGRRDAALAYDARRSTVVLQGGSDLKAPLADGWAWDGDTSHWSGRAAGDSAPAAGGSLFHDAERDVMLFVTSRLEVWERPAGDGPWREVGAPPVFAPSEPAVAFDTLRRKVIAYGGRDPGTQKERPDLSEWDVDRRQWSTVAVAMEGDAPSPRYGHTLVYDPRRETFFMYGGRAIALQSASGSPGSFREGWELTIGDLPTGERCSGAHATRCGHGSCVDGHCCSSGAPCVELLTPDAAALAEDAALEPDAGVDAGLPIDTASEPSRDAGVDRLASPADVPGFPPASDAGVSEPDAPEFVAPAEQDAAASNHPSLYAAPGCRYGGSSRRGAAPVLLALVLAAIRGRRRR